MTHTLQTYHIGLVVGDLDKAVETYRTRFGAVELAREQLPAQEVEACMLDMRGSLVELIAPTTVESGVRKFLGKRGEGFHHVAYLVDDILGELQRLKESGTKLVDETPRRGFGGHQVAFIHPDSAHGVLIELVEE